MLVYTCDHTMLCVCTEQHDKSVPYDTPRPLEVSEMPGIVQSYIKAAQNAEKAGFDFIEIHSANGYLLDSFLQSCSNKRTDEYGGSFENRFRLVREVIEGILTVFPADRLGIRFSPNGAFQDMVSYVIIVLLYVCTVVLCASNACVNSACASGIHLVCRTL
jgi:2,4-dienoyl-CoA reductase-like NADH-dependent reductase (Old Yellow Enzyme family)